MPNQGSTCKREFGHIKTLKYDMDIIFHNIAVDRNADRALGFEYTQISFGNTELPQPPRFWRGDFPQTLTRFFFSGKEVWPTGIYFANDVTVSGPGLLSRGATKFGIKETNTHIRAYENHSAMHGLSFPTEPKMRHEKPLVLLIGPGFDVYGHWLVDFLPKLYLLKTYGIDFRSCQYLLPDSTPSYGLEWLRLLGLTDSAFVRYPVREGCRAEKLIIPTLTRTNSRTSPAFNPAIDFVREEILKRHPIYLPRSSSGKRIFVSRGNTERNRKLKNRPQVEKIAKSLGFNIYFPEQESLLAQLQTFSDAHCCAGDYGSSLHGTVFCRPGVPVCALRWTQIDPGFLQSGIGDALSLPTGYIFGSLTGVNNEYFADPDDVAEGLRAALSLV